MSVQAIKVSPQLAHIIGNAGDKSGVDFDYLLQTASRESSLNPSARATTSSAVGLFQFLEQTWLDVIKSDGERLGYGEFARAIETSPNGSLTIGDKDLRNKVLKLREEPQIASDMAAAFTLNNGHYLQERFGRMPSAGELYIAHFMGARGAARLFEAGLTNPDQIASKLFPQQAKANPSIFFDNGKSRTIRQLYQVLVAKHTITTPASAEFAAQQLASGESQQAPQKLLPMSFRALYSGAAHMERVSPVQQPEASTGRLFGQIYHK